MDQQELKKLALDHYQVKYVTRDGVTHYGIYDGFHPNAGKWADKGLCIVQDAITPKCYAVPLKDIVDIAGGIDNEFDKFVEAEEKKAMALSDSLPAGVHVGSLFAVGVADGSAYYVVTRKTPRKCDIEWRGFCPDRWKDRFFGNGKKNLNVKDIAPLICKWEVRGFRESKWSPSQKAE